ncbi:MAG: hypothetical protein M1840_002225 [Geoglossum simile]|nr:MAG: hypothetical protein M1840_002225 [Geoglossum simile]
MADGRVNDLSYGHFGQAVYEAGRKEWVFARQPGVRNQLHLITPSRVSIPPSLRLGKPEKRPQYETLRQQTRLLGLHHPEFVPGLTLLPLLLHTSQLITSLTTVHDPTISTLLAFGRAVVIDNRRSCDRTISIAAIAGGEAGESVRIIQVRDERARWRGYKGVGISIPDVGGGEEGWWFGDGAPVRQICFGDSESGKTSWLALRLPASTIILRPLYRRLPTMTVASGSSGRRHLSRIDPNHLFTISMSRTGGAPHSDVAFNPWYNRRCAIIDQRGRWSVWDLEGQGGKGNLCVAKARQNGCVLDAPSGGNAGGDATEEDGWASVCWAGDVSTLVACTRRHLAVFDLKSNPPTRLKVPPLDLVRTPNWILDIRRSPINNSHLFVVTSSQVFKLEISGNDPDVGPANWKAGAQILLSWRHFRDGDDTSLRLEVMGSRDVEHVLLYSRFNKLVTTFQFSHDSGPSPMPISTSDPYIFPLPRDTLVPSEGDRPGTGLSPDISIAALYLVPLKYATRPNIAPTGPGQAYMEQGVIFFKLFILGNDLSLHDCLYASGVTEGDRQLAGESARRLVVKPPDDGLKLRQWAFRSTRTVHGDGFIIEDGAEEGSEREIDAEMPPAVVSSGIGNHAPRVIHKGAGTAQPQKDPGDVLTLNFEPIYELAFLQSDRRIESYSEGVLVDASQQGMEENRLDSYLRALQERVLAKRETGSRPIETLLELYMPPSYFEDIDRASVELRQFLDVLKSSRDEEPEMIPTIKVLVPYSFFKFPFQTIAVREQQAYTDLNSLSGLYDRLIDTWVASLPGSASGRTRLAKERIARRVAAELYLSSIGIALEDSERRREVDSSERAEPEGQSIEMPIRPRGGSQGVIGKGKGKEEREPLSSLQHSTRDRSLGLEARQVGSSDYTPSHYSYPSSSPGGSGTEDASCTRLRAYTQLTPQPSLLPAMSSILAHWKVGSDPSSYSWNATRAALAEDDGDKELTSGGDEILRHRIKREKRLKRQRLGTVESAASSQPMGKDRLWGSQPVAIARSSQGQADNNIVSASQVVRGIYGGQLVGPTAHKRKKRAAGF